MRSQRLCLAAQDRLRCACMIVASAPAAFAQSCKDVILLGRVLVCAKSVNVHYMRCAYTTWPCSLTQQSP